LVAPTVANSVPTAVGTYSLVSSYSATLTATITDSNGASDIDNAYLLLNSSLLGTNGCYVIWRRSTLQLGLHNDAATAISFVTPASNETAQNSQCTLSAKDSSIQTYANGISVNARVTVAPGFGGTKTFFVMGADRVGAQSGWTRAGDVTFATQGTAP